GMLLSGAQNGTPEQQAAFQARTTSAVAEGVQKQIEAGLDVVSDREQRKRVCVNYVKDRLNGFGGQATPFMAADMLDFQTQAQGGSATAIAQAQRDNPSAPPPNFTPACNGPISYRDHNAYKQDIANF